MQFSPYLYFRGQCEAALTFYAACGLGEMSEVMRFGDSPMAGGAMDDKIMHCRFEGPGLRFYASDPPDAEPMKGCALLLEPDGAAAGRVVFDALSAGGDVKVAYATQFWGDWYGNFTDRFGVQWAVNCKG